MFLHFPKINQLVRITTLAACFCFATASFAANVHLKPPKRNPLFTDNGLTLQVDGKLAGLGWGDVVISMPADALFVSTCTSPGGNVAPGQQSPISVDGSTVLPVEELKNGNTPFRVVTEAPDPVVIPGAPSCPNDKWTETITDLAFTSAQIIVYQNSELVLQVLCTFEPPTSDGVVHNNDVDCAVLDTSEEP